VATTTQRTKPSDSLREVPLILRTQWKRFTASRATVLRWVLASDEWDWVESFLEGRMDGVSKSFVIEHPADTMRGYGFAAGKPLLEALAKTRIAGRPAWVCPQIPSGMPDTDALAAVLRSFANYVEGNSLANICLVLAPERIADNRAWLHWVEALAGSVLRVAPTVRIVLLDDSDAARARYATLDRYTGAVLSIRADLGIAARVTEMATAASDMNTVEGQLRVLTVRAMQCVNEGRVDDGARLAAAVETLARDAGKHGLIVPVRFAVAGGFTAAHRHVDAVTSYRAAESAAESAQSHGDPNGLWLRIMARFGVASGLLAAPQGASRAGKHFEETAPLCLTLGDARLELEAFRCASVAYEIAKSYRAAWDAGAKALGVVDRLSSIEREGAMLVPLADAMLRLTETRELSSFRSGLEQELRKRRMRGTAWA
jgi:hypothetical protein